MSPRSVLRQMLRHYSPRLRARGVILRRFSKKLGLVYFGTVDQHVDEHEVLRGLTVSTTHKDAHYAVGSFDDYDLSIVDRFDVVAPAVGKPTPHSWLIFQVTLERADLPHLFFKPRGHSLEAYNKFFTAYNTLHIINDVFSTEHSRDFHSRYELYGHATHTLGLEPILTTYVTQALAAQFWPHAIEIFEGKLYVYITEHRLNETVLGSTLQATAWFAHILDRKTNEF